MAREIKRSITFTERQYRRRDKPFILIDVDGKWKFKSGNNCWRYNAAANAFCFYKSNLELFEGEKFINLKLSDARFTNFY